MRLVIYGTRPEEIKVYPFTKYPGFKFLEVNQSKDLHQGLIKPDYRCEEKQLKEVIKELSPELVLVQGDTRTAFYGALYAYEMGIKVAHIEAGLRTHDIWSPHPEEGYRMMIDQISTYKFCSTPESVKNCNGVYVGQTSIDTLCSFYPCVAEEDFYIVTVHRTPIAKILPTLKKMDSTKLKIIAHPNPIGQELKKHFKCLDPLNYKDFVYLLARSKGCISDSVSGDTRMYWKEDGEIRFGTIEDMFNSPSDNLEVLSVTRSGRKYKDAGPSMHTGKIVWADTIVIDHGIKKVYSVELKNGKRIKVTKDHSLFSTDISGNLIAKSFEEADKFVSVNYPISISESNNTDKDVYMATLYGLWVADGSWCGGEKCLSGIAIATGGDSKIIDFLNLSGYKIHHRGKGDIGIYSVDLARSMKTLGFDGRSKTKRVPKWLFTAPDNIVCGFLRGYFSGDGSCYNHKKQTIVSASSVNRDLIDDIQILLSRIGIVSAIDRGFVPSRLSDNKQYKLNIYRGWCVRKFLNRIGFIKNIKKDLSLSARGKDKEISVLKVRSVTYVGEERVFDLKVVPTESFVANGILCHNSGGLQEECAFLGKDYISLRDKTERGHGETYKAGATKKIVKILDK